MHSLYDCPSVVFMMDVEFEVSNKAWLSKLQLLACMAAMHCKMHPLCKGCTTSTLLHQLACNFHVHLPPPFRYFLLFLLCRVKLKFQGKSLDEFSSSSFTDSVRGSGSSFNSAKMGSLGSAQYESLATSSWWLLLQVSTLDSRWRHECWLYVLYEVLLCIFTSIIWSHHMKMK